MKNHFIIVGAQRSGTTYLYNLLNQHPEICMSRPTRPEPKYFINKTIDQINLKDYYQAFFSHCQQNTKITGEKSTSYYELEESAKLISESLPQAKIIFLLRDPVQRALSNYFFSYNNGIETRTLEEVFIEGKQTPQTTMKTSVDPFNYLERGKYAQYIKMYKRYFSESNIKVLIFEELKNNNDTIQDLYNFLEVDKNFNVTDADVIVNASKKEYTPTSHVSSFLKSYYAPFNLELETLLQRRVDIWE